MIGCQTAPTSSLNQPAEADELQVYLDAIQAESTLEAVQVRMTATAQTAGTTATAQVQQVQTTQTQQAWEVEITQTQQAWVAQSTDTAQVQQATASAESARQATQAHGTATQQAVIDELTFLKLERERITNRISAIVPWVLGIAAIAGLLLALTYWAKVEIDRRKAFRDSDGRVTQVLDINSKGTSFISTDRMAGESLHINPSGEMTSSIPDPGIRSQILMAVILAEDRKSVG